MVKKKKPTLTFSSIQQHHKRLKNPPLEPLLKSYTQPKAGRDLQYYRVTGYFQGAGQLSEPLLTSWKQEQAYADHGI